MCENANVWQRALKHGNWRDGSISPRAKPIMMKYTPFVPFFFQKKHGKITLLHQTQHFRKINPEPSLALSYASK
jgi:hypothetical protein